MTDVGTDQDYCPNCMKFGLPILLLRHAVAWNKASIKIKAPHVTAPFDEGVKGIALPENAACYTLRLLRSGYLYVFNEVRGQWNSYQVSEHSELIEFDIRDKAPPVPEQDEPSMVCSRHGAVPLVRCLMIPDAAHAGRLWIAFSGTAWTPEVLARHRTEAYRKRHMQFIDVGAWVRSGGKAQANLDSLNRLQECVAEYHFPVLERSSPDAVVVTAREAFRHAIEQPATLAEEADALIEAAQNAGKRWGYSPAMIAISDPVGVTMELARLIAVDLEDALDFRKQARPLAISSAIRNIQHAIYDDAENRQIYSSERDAQRMLEPGYMASGEAWAGMAIAETMYPHIREERQDLLERFKNPTQVQMATARRDAWAKYERKYDKARLAQWEACWNKRVADHDSNVTKPLALAHVQWMKSAKLYDHLDCNHDEQNVQSGKGFVEALLLCIQDTQQYKPCMDVYVDWLSDNQIGKSNLILRALGYNQKVVLEQLDEVAQGGMSPSALKGLAWSTLIDAYNKALESLGNDDRNAVIRLTVALGGPFAKVVSKAVDKVAGPGVVALGLIAKAPVIMVDATMSRGKAIAELTARMAALNPKIADLKGLNRAIDIQMRKARIYGVPVQEIGKFRYLIMADPQVVQDFPGVDVQGNARPFAKSVVLTELDRQRLTQMRWRKIFPLSAGLGVVTGILQAVALGKLSVDLDKSMMHEQDENLLRYGTGMVALIGTLGETTGKWLGSASLTGSRLAVSTERYVGKVLRLAGSRLGIAAGIFIALYDGIRGIKELIEGNAIGLLYIASATLSFVAIGALGGWFGPSILGVSSTGVGVVLVILVLILAVIIEELKDNKIQDWMERSYFGKFSPSDRYADLESELKELDIAIAG